MNPAAAAFLVSPDGKELLDAVASLPGDAAERVLALRKRRPDLSAEVAAAAVEVVDARRRARHRFPDAHRLFFTADALAQATGPVLAAYHAAGLARFGTVADLGCGVGMDALALAETGARVVAVDRDDARLTFARANAEARGLAHRIEFFDDHIEALSWVSAARTAFWDPSRRVEGRGRRVSLHPDLYEPPLTFLETLRAHVEGGCVKLSPALPDDVLDGLNGRVEFLSERGVCKEVCFWFGTAAGAGGAATRAAVLLPEGVVVVPENDAPLVGPVGAFVHDPDPALVRAGGLSAAARLLNDARLVSPDDSYLTGDAPAREVRLAASYRVTDALPYKPRILRDLLRARGVTRLIVKKRHFPHEPDAVARELGLRTGGADGPEAILILVRRGKGHLAVLCQPAAS